MQPFHHLDDALASMRFRVEPERFALLGFPEPPEPADLALVAGDGPAQVIREGGETTLLVPASAAGAVLERHPGAAVERDLAWIRFDGALAWDLVGFLARVTGRLAAAGVPLGAVCGYSRDHLFVAEPHLERATAALAELLGDGLAR
jgi:hypothetical protein